MSPLVNLPYDFEDGVDLALGSEVLTSLQAIVNVLHAIDYQNLAASPNFPGTCISSTPGSRIPSTRIEDDAVTSDKLRDATLDVDDLLRACTTNHYRNQSITRPKLASGTPGSQAVSFAQMDILAQTTAFSITLNDISLAAPITGDGILSYGVERATSGANYVFYVTATGARDSTNFAVSARELVTPATNIPTATYALIGLYISDAAYNAVTQVFTGNVVSIALKVS